MRICMISGEFPPDCGGVGSYVYNLSKKLVQKKHEVIVITRGSWKKTYFEVVDNIIIYRVRFLPIYPFHLQVHGFFIRQLFKSMNFKFDLIHYHSSIIPYIRTTFPSIITEHGTVKGYIDNLEIVDLFSLVEKIFSKMYVAIDHKVVKVADKVTAVSNSCAKELKTYYGVNNVDVVKNGVDTNYFVSVRKKNQTLYILYAGQLNSIKGLPDLIKSARYVCQNYPNIKFILIGKGPLDKYLKNLVIRFNLNKNFSFIRYIDKKKLLDFYQNASIHVLPSYNEGLPTVLLEAMSCGIPSVATNVGGNSEVVINGKTGILVPPKNPVELANAIMKLLENENLRIKMGKAGRKRVKEVFNWEIIVDRIVEIYKSILE